MEMAATTAAVRWAKLQWNHHHQQTNVQLFTGRMPFRSPNQHRQNSEGKNTQQNVSKECGPLGGADLWFHSPQSDTS